MNYPKGTGQALSIGYFKDETLKKAKDDLIKLLDWPQIPVEMKRM